MPRKNPFEDLDEMFDRMNSELQELGRQFDGEFGAGVDVDVAETDDDVVVTADLPGFDADDIEVSVADRELSLSAEHEQRREEERDEETHYHLRERSTQSVTRRLRLPAEVNETEATAEFENGVLTVTLPKVSDGAGGTSIDVE
ncbi:Hsp20/alpha crystallin family protein [Halobaculum sp. D14]|uniref:Hsp20/alpha crystallin family protein n=1 Tax=unclassified Halobaculum TaxID=2640896 RepID=UPI003EBB9BE5